jgi:hypothetical protein
MRRALPGVLAPIPMTEISYLTDQGRFNDRMFNYRMTAVIDRMQGSGSSCCAGMPQGHLDRYHDPLRERNLLSCLGSISLLESPP